MDLAALFPRWFTIRRGSFVIAAIGICINPWRILNVITFAELCDELDTEAHVFHLQTANSFISAMSAYGVFLGPLTGIMVVGALSYIFTNLCV